LTASPLLETLSRAGTVLVLTGAGISAESGIPTFRDALTGLWANHRAEDLATPEAFARNPERVWNWYASRREKVGMVQPNAGHFALARLQASHPGWTVVTQNVDGLHQAAGSSDVIELHGNIMRSICSITGKDIDDHWLQRHPGTPPRSPHHPSAFARPGVVWFGEALPEAALQSALSLAGGCDACLSVGTSSLVEPAASLPRLARASGALLIEINPEPTPISDMADLCVRGPSAQVLPELLSALNEV
jgi:NAD-dependent deacetylase